MPYIERDQDGAIKGLYAVRQPDYATEWLDADAPEVGEFLASFAPKNTVIFKADIWRRATDAEAATIDAALNAQPVRLRRMWQDSQTLATSDEMYPLVSAAFAQAFGSARAAELLEPTA